ncbi:hypothetical protein [Salirhabdus sp. Marseille-P4669]|uniref:hypothetical protein n=1 Tax=Salirhabdus sp. Marseille-P4669 TaxID=2042310 RepID=UPI000C7A03F0|nr:hypothetical protein [Salirhabdus sp. Marseille-P4669]
MDLLAIIAAIFFGIVSMFSRNKEEEHPKGKPIQRPKKMMTPKPTPTPSGRTYHEPKPTQKEPKVEPVVRVEEKHVDRSSIEDSIQLDTLASFDITKGRDVKTPSSLLQRKSKTHTLGGQSISVKEQLTQKRIVESLIMSEVLGTPRAHKPYAYHYKEKIK